MRSHFSVLLFLALYATSLAAQPATGGAVDATVNNNAAPPPAPTTAGTPESAIPDDPSIQIVAEPLCHTVARNPAGYAKTFTAAGLTAPAPNDCILTAAQASTFDRDLERAAGVSAATIATTSELVNKVLQSDDRFKRSFGALVHLARYKDPKDGSEPALDRDIWLVCNRGGKDPFHGDRFECGVNQRLYGRHNVAVLFVHTNIEFSHPKHDDVRRLSGFPAGQVAYYGLAKRRLPTPLENIQGILEFIIAGAKASTENARVALLGVGWFHEMPVPSKLTVVAARKKEVDGKTEVERVGGKLELLNEGLYFIDFSLGVPVSKLTALEFTDTAGNFTPKEVNRQSAYAMANIYFLPVDLSSGIRRYVVPRAVFGVGITGTLGRNFMVGGSLGPPFLQFFVGSEFARRDMTLPSGEVEKRFRSHLTYGINIPIMSALQKLKAQAAGE